MALAARAIAAQPKPHPHRERPGKRARRARIRVAGKGVRTLAIVAVPLALILSYVALTAQLTAQTYRLQDDQLRQQHLLARNNELRQQVARLESLPRLEAAAAKLQMTVPSGVSLIAPAHAPHSQPPPTALAASIAGLREWLHIP